MSHWGLHFMMMNVNSRSSLAVAVTPISIYLAIHFLLSNSNGNVHMTSNYPGQTHNWLPFCVFKFLQFRISVCFTYDDSEPFSTLRGYVRLDDAVAGTILVWVQPMKDAITMYRRLSLAEPIPRMTLSRISLWYGLFWQDIARSTTNIKDTDDGLNWQKTSLMWYNGTTLYCLCMDPRVMLMSSPHSNSPPRIFLFIAYLNYMLNNYHCWWLRTLNTKIRIYGYVRYLYSWWHLYSMCPSRAPFTNISYYGMDK